MIKAMGFSADGKRMLILGLSRENCERLLEGKPIFFRAEDDPVDMSQPFAAMLIVGGETEDAIAKELRARWKGGVICDTSVPACHYLRSGRTLCGLTGAPDTWPAGHSWVPAPSEGHSTDATCVMCRTNLDVERGETPTALRPKPVGPSLARRKDGVARWLDDSKERP